MSKIVALYKNIEFNVYVLTSSQQYSIILNNKIIAYLVNCNKQEVLPMTEICDNAYGQI